MFPTCKQSLLESIFLSRCAVQRGGDRSEKSVDVKEDEIEV